MSNSKQGFWARLMAAFKGDKKAETTSATSTTAKAEKTTVDAQATNAASDVFELMVPISGNLISLSEIPDPVFSQGMMGTGFGIEPTEGKVVSPVSGKVISVFPTKHAVTLQADNGTEILIHFGLDTTLLKGEGFTSHVTDGQAVKAGDLLLTVDVDAIRDKVSSLNTPVVFPSLSPEQKVVIKSQGQVTAGEKGRITIE